VTDLERFFVQLVRSLAAHDRTRLGKPLVLGDIRNSILPYRAHRRALELDSSEDYELVLMRLCAGEGGFARTGPDEIQDEFRQELESPNPDLTLVGRRENAVVHLEPKAVAKALDPQPELAYAPPEQATPTPTPKSRGAAKPKRASPLPRSRPQAPDDARDNPQRCPRCGGGLPVGRVVNFCPQCGQNLSRQRCPQCQAELETGWRHCANCGHTLQDI
jgi:Double zinc ribbon